MRTLALLLCLIARPALADGNALALWLLEQEQAQAKQQQVDFDRTEAFNKLLREQLKPPAQADRPVSPQPPRAATPPAPAASKPKAATWHYEYRPGRGSCPNGQCPLVRVKVWDEPQRSAAYYPTRSRLWTTNENIYSHLVSDHGMDPAWVRSLSNLEARSVHSDVHDAEKGDREAAARVRQFARRR